MASFTVTISENVNLFGAAPTDLWNSYNWNSFFWGEGTSPLQAYLITNIDEVVSLTDEITSIQINMLNDSMSLNGDMGLENLYDGNGYLYVFPSNVTDGEQRYFPSYSSLSAGAQTWTSQTLTDVIWS